MTMEEHMAQEHRMNMVVICMDDASEWQVEK